MRIVALLIVLLYIFGIVIMITIGEKFYSFTDSIANTVSQSYNFNDYVKTGNYIGMYKCAKRLTFYISTEHFETDNIQSVCKSVFLAHEKSWPSLGRQNIVDAIINIKDFGIGVIIYACATTDMENPFSIRKISKSTGIRKGIRKCLSEKYTNKKFDEQTLLALAAELNCQRHLQDSEQKAEENT